MNGRTAVSKVGLLSCLGQVYKNSAQHFSCQHGGFAEAPIRRCATRYNPPKNKHAAHSKSPRLEPRLLA